MKIAIRVKQVNGLMFIDGLQAEGKTYSLQEGKEYIFEVTKEFYDSIKFIC